jgi:hypothetical protein
MNGYQYVRSNPLTYTDPQGLAGGWGGYGMPGGPQWPGPRRSGNIDTDGNIPDQIRRFGGMTGTDLEALKKAIARAAGGGCLSDLTLLGHGQAGAISFGPMQKQKDGTYNDKTFMIIKPGNVRAKNSPEAKFLEFLASKLCKDARVDFGTCKSGKGKDGADLEKALEDLFRGQGKDVDVILHGKDTYVKWGGGVGEDE